MHSIRGLSALSVYCRSLSKKSKWTQRERSVDAECTLTLFWLDDACVDAERTQGKRAADIQQIHSRHKQYDDQTRIEHRLVANQTEPGSALDCLMARFRVQSRPGFLTWVCLVCDKSASGRRSVLSLANLGLRSCPVLVLRLLSYVTLSSLWIFSKWATLYAAWTQSANWVHSN